MAKIWTRSRFFFFLRFFPCQPRLLGQCRPPHGTLFTPDVVLFETKNMIIDRALDCSHLIFRSCTAPRRPLPRDALRAHLVAYYLSPFDPWAVTFPQGFPKKLY